MTTPLQRFEDFPNYERLRGDRFATQTVGVVPLECVPGRGVAQLTVDTRHLNGIGITQGGAVFTLADFALAICANSDVARPAVLIESHISYLAPSYKDDTLTAVAQEIARTRKLVSVETTVTNQHGQLIAKFSGRAYCKEQR